ncbi:MAG TPA: hypothetical protein VMT30_01620 [Candidatus Saccharimonadia bacterium]|nr:hypothetical protein [Candidatus Saccharimonadia bacterium]
MKQKDVIYAVLAVVILMVAGYIGYTQLVPKNANGKSTTVEVEKIGVIPGDLDSAGLDRIGDGGKVIDYNSTPDLSGLGNSAPFGP